jgi:hypothetical protein
VKLYLHLHLPIRLHGVVYNYTHTFTLSRVLQMPIVAQLVKEFLASYETFNLIALKIGLMRCEAV